MPWVREAGVHLGDLDPARADEDAFDSHLTAAAALRCAVEGTALCERRWTDRVAEGAMLLAGPVDPTGPTRTLNGTLSSRHRVSRRPRADPLREHADHAVPSLAVRARPESAASTVRLAYPCPIPGCSKIFHHTRGGWDAHVASLRKHPDWHPRLNHPEDRKRRFKDEFRHWFHK